MLDLKFYIRLAKDVVPMFRTHTFMKALDVYGNKFKGYSKDYGEAKRAGKLKRQASEFKNTTAPILSSDLLRDWRLHGTTSTGFKFGTLVHGGKVEHLEKLGRVLATENKPLPDKIASFIMKQADKYVKKELGKIKGRTFNI